MSVNKFYHIVLLGFVGTNTTNQTSDCLFYFDWGRLPRSRWRVYICGNTSNQTYNTNQQCLINVDLGQQQIELAKGTNGDYGGISQQDKNIYVGCFTNPAVNGGNSIFQINSTANPPIYLDATPTNNSFLKTLRNHGSARALFTPNQSTDKIILSFEQLDDPVPRSIKTSYQVVFNSTSGTMNTVFGNYSYFFDWTTIPRGEYFVDMTLVTNANSANEIRYTDYSVFIDLGQGNSTVFYPSNKSNANIAKKNFVGMTLFQGINGAGQSTCLPLYAMSTTTKPLYLKSRPSNNIVDVIIADDYAAQFVLSLTNNALYNYTLVLNFNLLV